MMLEEMTRHDSWTERGLLTDLVFPEDHYLIDQYDPGVEKLQGAESRPCFDITTHEQIELEEIVQRVVVLLDKEVDPSVLLEKSKNDKLLVADVQADSLYKSLIRKSEPEAWIFSEEGNPIQGVGSVFYELDPVDGSSGLLHAGAGECFLATAVMKVDSGQIVGLAAGDITLGYIWGVDSDGLYKYPAKKKHRKNYIRIPRKKTDLRLKDSLLTSYTVPWERARIFSPSPWSECKGIASPRMHFRVGDPSEDSPAAALEPYPVRLHEHIVQLMLQFAGASTRRLDGEFLRINPWIMQTSICSASRALADEIIECLDSRIERHSQWNSLVSAQNILESEDHPNPES